MDIKEFIEEYKNTVEPMNLIDKHITRRYVTFLEKTTWIEIILRNSMYREINGKNVFIANTPLRHVFFFMSVIRLYTDIEFEDAKAYEAYDALKETGAMDAFMRRIGNDLDDFQAFLDMSFSDLINKEQNLTGWLDREIEATGIAMATFAESVANILVQRSEETA